MHINPTKIYNWSDNPILITGRGPPCHDCRGPSCSLAIFCSSSWYIPMVDVFLAYNCAMEIHPSWESTVRIVPLKTYPKDPFVCPKKGITPTILF